MTITECNVTMQQVGSFFLAMLISSIITIIIYAAIIKLANQFDQIKQKIIGKQEFLLVPSFVAITVFMLSSSPFKHEAKQTMNSITYFKGKEVIPCDKNKDKETKVSFSINETKITICSL